MPEPETKSAIQADLAWSHFTKTLAYSVPKHLTSAQASWRKMRRLRKGL